jgi:hypothetical protein
VQLWRISVYEDLMLNTQSRGTRDDKGHEADENHRLRIMGEKSEYKPEEQRGWPKGSEPLRARERIGVKWL